MSDAPEDDNRRVARPASVDDLKQLLRSLKDEGVEYVLIGGYALYALGYERGTTHIDLLLRPTREQGERVRRALLRLPDQVAREIDPAWFDEGDMIRVADEFVVDLMFTACGESLDTLQTHIVSVDLDGVEVRTLDVKGPHARFARCPPRGLSVASGGRAPLTGLLKTKQTSRANDKLDRAVLEGALQALKGTRGEG